MTTPAATESAAGAVRRRAGLPPALAVTRELLRAVGALALLPVRVFDYAMCREALRTELELDIAHPSVPAELAPRERFPNRPLKIFVSCAEASGELHALNLLDAIRADLRAAGAPEPEFVGLGSDALASRGVRIVGDPVSRAAMMLDGMARALPFYLGLLRKAAAVLRNERPDACVLVDSPALHVPLGRIARGYGVPVVHFVAPQLWGWAPWRAGGYRSAVDLTLTILPFEPAWFARRGIPTLHIGHPLLDELADVPSTRPSAASRVLVLLPGSRSAVLQRNLPWMLRAAAELRRRVAEIEIVIAHADRTLEPMLREALRAHAADDWVRLELGDLHGSLARARAAFSVSGTVLLDLLHHRLPAVIVYRLRNGRGTWMYRHVLTAPWFGAVNLLAGREVEPEFCFHGDGPLETVVGALQRCFEDERWRRSCREGLELAADRLGPAGACRRAARAVLSLALPREPT